MPTGSWAEMRTYDHLAFDPRGRKLHFRGYDSSVIHEYDLADGRSTPGKRADGRNKFLVGYEATVHSKAPPPGLLMAYVYHPEQRDELGTDLGIQPLREDGERGRDRRRQSMALQRPQQLPQPGRDRGGGRLPGDERQGEGIRALVPGDPPPRSSSSGILPATPTATRSPTTTSNSPTGPTSGGRSR